MNLTDKKIMIPILKKTAIGTGCVLIAILVLILMYCWHLSNGIEKRFSGRKWKLPSSVYSDTTLLFTDKKISVDDLENKLIRIGYKLSESQPEKKGEYALVKGGIEIYFNDLNLPGNIREGFPAAIDIRNKTIKKIKRIDTEEILSTVELDPELVMQYFGKERELRKIVSIKHVPKHLIHAVLAAEDGRFFSHLGIDPIGIFRALYVNLRAGYIQQGGSTLTQQLAKNYFLSPERTIKRKINELLISLSIELKYSKEDILEIYLNEIYFGQKASISINGVGEAANFYFGKEVENITLSEAAIIAGLIKAPNKYSPYSHVEKCKKRRDLVLYAMHKKEWISDSELKRALIEPITTVGVQKKVQIAPYFMDYVSSQLNDLYPETALSSLGFSIYTTLDLDVQAAAEEALEKGLTKLEEKNPELKRFTDSEKLQGAILVIQPRTGNILALVGGRDYKQSQFNRITQAKRQAGSCFKPLVVATLLDLYKPSDLLSNAEMSYMVNGAAWTPNNYGVHPEKSMTVREMLRVSCNRAAVDMVVTGGEGHVAEGVKAFNFSTEIYPYPSIALGSFEVIPLELARAYCAFAADGVEPHTLSLKDVIDENGHVLVRKYMDIQTVMSPAKAYLVTSMLETVAKTGTAKTLLNRYGINFPVAGKTGSTNGYKDAWFVGYTPDLLILVWVGFDNGESIDATGSGAAIPIFADLIKSIPDYITKDSFAVPQGVVKLNLCKQSRKIATSHCPDTYTEYFLEENKTEDACNIHTASRLRKVLEDIQEDIQEYDFDDYEDLFN
ncbi:MAG: PBP1A family penicillin-binding protein [Desulfobacteraceae bacterium]|jgi:penicillin-binding protein 1B